MLLVLRDPSRPDAPMGVNIGHLLGKAGKDGKPSVRGPRVDSAEGSPLAALRDGDKLHIVAPGDRRAIAGLAPKELVKHLGALGLGREVRLAQIHLLSDDAGTGGEASYARRFAGELASEGYAVQEIKAPRGAVRTAPSGKVLVKPSAAGDKAIGLRAAREPFRVQRRGRFPSIKRDASALPRVRFPPPLAAQLLQHGRAWTGWTERPSTPHARSDSEAGPRAG